LDEIFESVNGFFFPGGSSSFPTSAQYIYDKVVKANDAGDFMPLWGTCMGFQWLLIAQSRDSSILDPPSGQMDSYNLTLALLPSPSFASSKLFAPAPASLKTVFTSLNVTMNNHHYGIFPDHLKDTPSLKQFFSVLSTNFDRQGVEFVSTIEAFKYPIFGSQWHPEKNIFE
jgi:gamma-glutamyl hydrolase